MAQDEKNVWLDVYERLGGIDAKLDNINQIRNVAQRADETANMAQENAQKALESCKSAHHRLDKIDQIIFWTSTTIIGAVIVALIALVIR